MSTIRIVTDSSAHFHQIDSTLSQQIAIVPHSICLGGRSYREGVDVSSEEFLDQLVKYGGAPEISPPSPEDFAAQFVELSRSTHEIVCVCVSRKLSRAWHNARQAAQPLLGKLDIAVIDSMSISVGLGILAHAAAKFSLEQISVTTLRRSIIMMIPRIYSAFFANSMEDLYRFGRAGSSQAILGDMLGVKPIFAMEDGDLAPMEKVSTRAQAAERLIEFASEFSNIEALYVLYGRRERAVEARQLYGRLAAKFPRAEISSLVFHPSLATLVGPDGLGLIVHER